MSTVKVNINGVAELDFPAGVSSASVLNGVATINLAGGSGSGTVTSVALTGDGTIFNATVAGSPVTSAGTLVPALLTQAANKILAGPTSGGAVNPTFRLLVAGDIPNLPASIITTGQLALARGGTNADLSATGGASQVLKQVSVGAAITVGQLAASDLSNGVTGSGAVVLATSATLVTPTLGVASATSLAISAQTLQSDTGRYGTGAIRVQSTGTNAASVLTLMPSGSSTESDIRMYNTSDPANVGAVEFSLVGTTLSILTENFGTGNKPTTIDLSGFATAKAASVITGASQLQLQETGDTFGTVNMYLRNRTGQNGAIFENTGVCLADFGMMTSAVITNVAINGSNVLTVSAVFASGGSSLPAVGQQVNLSGLTTATFLNGQSVFITSISATQFTASFTHGLYASAPDTGTATCQLNIRSEFRSSNVVSALNTSGEIQFFVVGASTPWMASGAAATSLTGQLTVTNGDSGRMPATITGKALSGNTNVVLGSGTSKGYAVIGVVRGASDVVGDRAYAGWFFATAQNVVATEVALHAETADAGTATIAEFYAGGVQKAIIDGGGNITTVGTIISPQVIAGSISSSSFVFECNASHAGDAIAKFRNTSATGFGVKFVPGTNSNYGLAVGNAADTLNVFSVDGTGFVTASSSINSTVGFQQNGTAGSGHVLRGNGSNFVDAALIASDIPSLDASKITTGLLALARGGTNADLSATGGASQVLKQVSAGAAITVGQLAASDLSNGVTGSGAVVLASAPTITSLAMSGKITTYNNIVTVANGTPSEVAVVALTAQAAAKATTTLYAVPASGAGQYNVNWNAKVTRAATTSATLGALTITYTDPDGVAVTLTALAQTAGGVAATTNTANSLTAALYGQITLNCKASTNITYAFAYVSSGTTTMQYNLNIVLEAL